MGNSIGGRRKAKVMKIDGQTFKLRTPARAQDVVKDYPGHVLLDSAAVKQVGLRARPLEPQEELKPKKIYFLVELPEFPREKAPRRVRSGVQMSAKDRLECLMLSRRSVSDLSLIGRVSASVAPDGTDTGTMRVKLRLPKAQVDKLVAESKDEAEVAEKIVDLYAGGVEDFAAEGSEGSSLQGEGEWKPGLDSIRERSQRPEVRFG
ncbi:uncharacterized protein At1g66480-like [Malania oleifera]|uniref:uncharacterized protein At1g66480-like n=1 Tax=Malania oleifera TaxID=397392 RepID=UPI0025ADEF05|nr:uncharacterized protein At1g66480-like [Malania oleifera]